MHRIDTPTAQKDKFGAGKNGFTRGNPQTGTPATDLDDDYFDMLQEELAGVVEASGVNLEKSKHNQLLTALKALLLNRAHPFADIKADGAAAIAEALSNLGLGTAATSDVTTSKIDNTSGRVLKVGDFGLGSQTYGVIPDSRQVSERSAYGVSFSRVYKSPDAPRMDTYYNLLMLPDTLNGTFSALAMSGNETPIYRAYGVGSNNSTNWVKIYDEKNKPTPADIGALPAIGGKLTGPLEIESDAPCIQLTETDTGKKYFIVVDNGNIRINQDTLSGVNGILSFDTTTKDWILPGGVIPKKYDNFNSLFQKINTSSLGTNGWFKDTNTGLIIQYGIAGGEGAAKNYPIQFPIAFPSRCLSIQVTLQSASWDPSSGSAMGQIINNTQAYCWSTHSFFWFAIGL